MIDLNALVMGQKAVDAAQQEMTDRILRGVQAVKDPYVYFKLMGGDYEIEVRTSNKLSRDVEDQIGDIIDEVRKEFGIYPALEGGIYPALEGGLTVYFTTD